MYNICPFSFIILTYNEEIHLPRLLSSIESLDAAVFVLDSGSSDRTVEIAKDANGLAGELFDMEQFVVPRVN